MTALKDLEKRLETASGPDTELDLDIRRWIDAPAILAKDLKPSDIIGRARNPGPAYTASLDAAVSLAERVLPGDQWQLEGPKTPCATLYSEHIDDENHFAATPAIAMCLATVRALISKGGAGG